MLIFCVCFTILKCQWLIILVILTKVWKWCCGLGWIFPFAIHTRPSVHIEHKICFNCTTHVQQNFNTSLSDFVKNGVILHRNGHNGILPENCLNLVVGVSVFTAFITMYCKPCWFFYARCGLIHLNFCHLSEAAHPLWLCGVSLQTCSQISQFSTFIYSNFYKWPHDALIICLDMKQCE